VSKHGTQAGKQRKKLSGGKKVKKLHIILLLAVFYSSRSSILFYKRSDVLDISMVCFVVGQKSTAWQGKTTTNEIEKINKL
jgi:hypothetical protein